jgi:transketolase
MGTPSHDTLQAGSKDLAAEASELRKEIIRAFNSCGGGHYGGSLSVIDIVLTLYRKFLRVSPKDPHDPVRDRFILSKGHAAMAYYAVLRKLGFAREPLETYGKFGSVYEGHPDMTTIPGIDFNTGSLGQGLSVGIGMAIALRGTGARVWVVLGDGECQEGQVWEAAMQAARYRIDNICAVIDCNKHQEWGWNYDKTLNNDPVQDIHKKWSAFGWHVLEVDGHDHDALSAAFGEATLLKGLPTLIIANTVKGKGVPMMETDPERFHCTEMTVQEKTEIDKLL